MNSSSEFQKDINNREILLLSLKKNDADYVENTHVYSDIMSKSMDFFLLLKMS